MRESTTAINIVKYALFSSEKFQIAMLLYRAIDIKVFSLRCSLPKTLILLIPFRMRTLVSTFS